jgi:hypothetical protein
MDCRGFFWRGTKIISANFEKWKEYHGDKTDNDFKEFAAEVENNTSASMYRAIMRDYRDRFCVKVCKCEKKLRTGLALKTYERFLAEKSEELKKGQEAWLQFIKYKDEYQQFLEVSLHYSKSTTRTKVRLIKKCISDD